MKTLSIVVSDDVHEAMRKLKFLWRVGNLDSVVERCVLKVAEEDEKSMEVKTSNDKNDN